jgi:hypothetical protein
VVALAAANRLPGITKLAMYEPPFIVDGSRPPLPADYVTLLTDLVAAGRRDSAVPAVTAIALYPRSRADHEAASPSIPESGRILGRRQAAGEPPR